MSDAAPSVPYVRMPAALIVDSGVTDSAKFTWLWLSGLAGASNQIRVSHAEIADGRACSSQSIARHLRELVWAGWVSIVAAPTGHDAGTYFVERGDLLPDRPTVAALPPISEETRAILERLAVALDTDVAMLLVIADGGLAVDSIAAGHPGGHGMISTGTLAEWTELVRDVADKSENGWEARRRREEAADRKRSSHRTRRDTQATPERPCVLYRLFDETGRVLYVGVSRNPTARLKAHRRKWGDLIASVTTEEYPDADSMLAAEAEAIRTENPPLNIKGVEGDGWAEQQTA